jgi:hypothetical protein
VRLTLLEVRTLQQIKMDNTSPVLSLPADFKPPRAADPSPPRPATTGAVQ